MSIKGRIEVAASRGQPLHREQIRAAAEPQPGGGENGPVAGGKGGDGEGSGWLERKGIRASLRKGERIRRVGGQSGDTAARVSQEDRAIFVQGEAKAVDFRRRLFPHIAPVPFLRLIAGDRLFPSG